MYPVSEAFLQAVQENTRRQKWSGKIATTKGVEYEFTDKDIVKGSGYITRQCCGSAEIELGSVYAAEMGITLFLDADRYSLEDATVELFYSIKLADGSWETIPMGIFEISEANRNIKTLEIKAYDYMLRFEKSASTESSSGCPYDFLSWACEKCKVELAHTQEEIEAMPNGTELLGIYPDGNIETYRDLLFYVAQVLGKVFLIMSDTDATFNFLISMIYTQLFNLLCEKADDVYGGRLPVHVTCLIDEMANIGQIPNLEKLMATIRSREISACLVIQAKSQLKAIYKDNAETIIGNCDSQIFMGGSEQTTLKDLNTTLGKETIDMYNTGETRGQSQSYNMNYQKLGHDLMSIDELAVMDGLKCIVQVRGVRPFFSDKYDLTKHPKYSLTADADKRNWFDIEKFLKKKDNLILKADDQFTVIEVTE